MEFDIQLVSQSQIDCLALKWKKKYNPYMLELFDIKEKRILISQEISHREQQYALFHAVWEILLSILGQTYDHSSFQAFSLVLFSVLQENNLGCTFDKKKGE